MDVSGIWYNELNSTVELEVHGRELRGWYITAVGNASGPYALVGHVDVEDETPTLGWVVGWQNDKKSLRSLTTWCGQAQEIDGEQMLDTTWLLVRSTSVKDDWEATMIAKDVFRRVKATDEQVRLAMMQRGLLKSK